MFEVIICDDIVYYCLLFVILLALYFYLWFVKF